MALISACDLSSMIAAAKCFDCLNAIQKRALRAHFLALALQGYGGADLRSLSVRNDAVDCIACLPDFRIESVLVAIDQKRASSAGASVDLSIDQLLASARCASQGTQDKLNRAAIAYLRCSLAQLGR
jgi:hypothetical protein